MRYTLNVKDNCVKAAVDESVPMSSTAYKSYMDVEIYCSSLGVPSNENININLSYTNSADFSYANNYLNNTIDTNIDNFVAAYNQASSATQTKIAKHVFKKDMPSTITADDVINYVYQGQEKLNLIKSVASEMSNRTQNNGGSYSWYKKGTSDKFQLGFYNSDGTLSNSKMVQFVNGKATIRVAMD